MIPFERDGRHITAAFSAIEVQLVSDLAVSITQLLAERASAPDDDAPGTTTADPVFASAGIGGFDSVSTDPAIARLLPDAYRDDDGAASDFRRLTERSLADRKVAIAWQLIHSMAENDGVLRLDEESAIGWLKGLADIRLVIAARLGIEHDGDDGTRGSDDDGDLTPDEAELMSDLYSWLAWVTESLVDALDTDPTEDTA